jgi:hypothetical protein
MPPDQQQYVQSAPVPAEPAWNDEWADRFRDLMKDQGVSSKTRMMLVQNLAQLGLGEQDLQAALEYYATAPEGKAELAAIDEQVRASGGQSALPMLAMGGLALAGAGVTTAMAMSGANTARQLARAAAGGADDAVRTVAGRAFDQFSKGALKVGSSLADDAAKALRAEAAATSRLLHPIRKAATNAAARSLTAAAKLPAAEVAKYGLWMRTGDAVADAARGAGMLSKAGKVLGPVGIAASAALGIWGIKQTVDAEGGFGEESAKMTGNVAGGLGGGIAGAAAGAALGSVVPVIGTGVGAVVGGLVGGLGGGAIGEKLGGFVHGLFD